MGGLDAAGFRSRRSGMPPRCGGRMSVIATIEAADVLRKILGHLGLPTDPPAPLPARPPSLAARPLPRHPGLTRRLRAAPARVCPDPDDDCVPGSPPSPQAENFLDHRFVRLAYGSGEERRDREERKSAARGGGSDRQGYVNFGPNGDYALAIAPPARRRRSTRAVPLRKSSSQGHWKGLQVNVHEMRPTSHCAIRSASPMLQALSWLTSQSSGCVNAPCPHWRRPRSN